MAHAEYERWAAAGWRGRKHRDWAWDGRGDPLEFVSTARHLRQLRDRPAVCVWRLETDDAGLIFLKHIRGPKNRPADQISWLARLKWWLAGSRAAAVLRVHGQMERAGLRVPRVLLAASRRAQSTRRAMREDVLVTRAEEAAPLSRVLRIGDAGSRQRALAQAGAALAALHRAGFVHGDPSAANVLVPDAELETEQARERGPGQEQGHEQGQQQAQRQACWLDNDRTRRWGWVPWPLRRRNLAVMTLRVLIQAPWREVRVLLRAYGEAIGADDHDVAWRRQRLRVIRRIRRRERRGGRTRLEGAARPPREPVAPEHSAASGPR